MLRQKNRKSSYERSLSYFEPKLICYQLRSFVEGARKLFPIEISFESKVTLLFPRDSDSTFSLTRFSLGTSRRSLLGPLFGSVAWSDRLFITQITTIPDFKTLQRHEQHWDKGSSICCNAFFAIQDII